MLEPAGSALARIRGDGTVNATSGGASSQLLLGSEDAGSGYEFDMRSVWEEGLCTSSGVARPAAVQACNRYACPAPITDASTAPALLYLSFPALLSLPALGPGSASRAAFLAAVASEVSTLLARLDLPALVAVTTTSSDAQLNVSLVPTSMAWVDLEPSSNGTLVMLQLLSEAAVRALFSSSSNATGAAVRTSRLRRMLAASGSRPLSATAVANQLVVAMKSSEGAAKMRGLTFLPQAQRASYATMTPENMPGFDPTRGQPKAAQPAAGYRWQDDPKAVGGLAAGVVVAGLLMAAAAAALFVVRRRRTSINALTKAPSAERAPPSDSSNKLEPEYFDMVNPGAAPSPRQRSSRALVVDAAPAPSPQVAAMSTRIEPPRMLGSTRALGGGLGHSSRKLSTVPVHSRKSAFLPERTDGRSELAGVPEETAPARPPAALQRQGSKLLGSSARGFRAL